MLRRFIVIVVGLCFLDAVFTVVPDGLSRTRSAAAAGPPVRDDKSRALAFETGGSNPLGDWGGEPSGPSGTLFLDSAVVHGGRYSGRLERTTSSPSTFSSFAIVLPVDFVGDTLELRGWLKYDGVTGYAGLWQRQDGTADRLAFDNMAARKLTGTADWTEHRIALGLASGAKQIVVGALLVGAGRVWVDDLRLYVDGKPLSEVPVQERLQTAIDRDREFDAGSRVQLGTLTPVQVENLVTLGKVWGFLKYHHPTLIAGNRHWDYDLFRMLPGVIAAKDRAAAQRVLTAWVDSLGTPPPCKPCLEAPRNRAILPRLEWLSDRSRLGSDLGARLKTIHARRPNVEWQNYVGQVQMVGNPIFHNEAIYRRHKGADAGYRLLALYRFWNVIQYWFPYRDLLDEDWDGVLREFIPRIASTSTPDDYAATMMALIARVHDTHANLWSSLDIQPPRGTSIVPVDVRFVEGQAVVAGYAHDRLGPASGLKVGDVIQAVDGVAVDTLVARWRPMYAASNEASRLRDMGRNLTRGTPGTARLTVRREAATVTIEASRVPSDSLDSRRGWTHDLPGPTFRRLSADVAYLKLSTVATAEVPDYVRGMAGAKCLIIDIRNYPSAFMVFDLGQHLVDKPTEFARFTSGDLDNPGAFDFGSPVSLIPKAPYFEGGVAILVDEVSQSQAEYTAMAMRARPGSVVVGSTTSGADGNVSPLALPGGLRTMISGIGVFYPDRRPTQRIGIVPDVVARPTIAGIGAGRDEVLEAAIQRVLGRAMTKDEQEAARTPPKPGS